MIPRIITITCLMVFLQIPTAYAEYPTSTPETMGPLNLIDGIGDALLGGGSAVLSRLENMAARSLSMRSIPTVTWDGGGADDLSSNLLNWSSDISLQNGDGVVFDETSSKNCTWDLPVILASLNINSGYTGKVTITADLTINGDFTWTGYGNDDFASNPANWSGGVVPQDGDDVDFKGTEDCLWDINIAPASLRLNPDYTGSVTLYTDISITGNLSIEGGILNSNDKAINIEGNLFIGPYGTLNGTSSVITVQGDWINYGVFNAGTSTVILNGFNQTIYGSTTFYNLVKTTAADILQFEAGSTQTIQNNLFIQRASDNLLSLRSTVDGQYWYINPQGTRSISFADIRDMNNISATGITIHDSQDSGHNNNIGFSSEECACVNRRRMLAQVNRDDGRLPC